MVAALFRFSTVKTQVLRKSGMGPGGAGTEGAFPLLSSTESSFLFCHHSSPHCPVQAVIQFPLRVPVTVGFHVVLLLQRLTSGCKGEGAFQSSASLLESVHRTLPLRKPGHVSGPAWGVWGCCKAMGFQSLSYHGRNELLSVYLSFANKIPGAATAAGNLSKMQILGPQSRYPVSEI